MQRDAVLHSQIAAPLVEGGVGELLAAGKHDQLRHHPGEGGGVGGTNNAAAMKRVGHPAPAPQLREAVDDGAAAVLVGIQYCTVAVHNPPRGQCERVGAVGLERPQRKLLTCRRVGLIDDDDAVRLLRHLKWRDGERGAVEAEGGVEVQQRVGTFDRVGGEGGIIAVAGDVAPHGRVGSCAVGTEPHDGVGNLCDGLQ